MPHDDSLWNARSEDVWRAMYPANEPPFFSVTLDAMLGGSVSVQGHQRYAFGGLALLYGLHNRLRQYSGCAGTLQASGENTTSRTMVPANVKCAGELPSLYRGESSGAETAPYNF